MKSKIILSLILIVVLITSFSIVNAADNSIFSITNGQGYKNGEVTVFIKLEKELEFASADLVLEYDTSKLEYVKYNALSILNDSAMNIVKNNSDTGKIAIGYVSNPEDAVKKKKPDQILSITFKIKANENESTNLILRCTTLKTDAGDSIEAVDSQSKITVIGKSSSNNNNNNNNEQRNNNTSLNVVNPPKEASSPLPYTGNRISIIVVPMIIFTIGSLCFYKKYNNLKDI